jgi:methionyl-tRNA formyltransferase
MRLIMMGTGPFAVPTFRSLLDSGHEVPLLVTRPAPVVRTRGEAPRNPMRDVAEARGVDVFAPEDVNSADARKTLAAHGADLLVVCDYGQILSADALGVTPLGGINLHGSLLPRFRGAAPVQWAILQGEARTGVTVIHMTPRLDAGPCLAQRSVDIASTETAAELEPRLAELGVAAVHEAIDLLAQWDRQSPIGTPQDPALASRAPRLRKTDGQVDWSRSADQLFNQVRALKPWPGTYTHWLRGHGAPLRIILDEVSTAAGSGQPGQVLTAENDHLLVATSNGALAIHRLQPAGKRLMQTAEFLRGHPVQPGETFGEA